MKGSAYTVVYSAILGAVCALLLTGASRLTAPYQEANAEAEEKRNILRVLGIPFEEKASSRDLLRVFEKNVRIEKRGNANFYLYIDPDAERRVQALAVPFDGPGVWGPIKGFLSLKPDYETIRGITFYKHEETPGLGGEIESEWFRNQFKGKSIKDAQGRPGIRILRGGGAKALNEVDGITGATMTSQKVEAILNSTIKRIVQERGTNGK